MKTIQELLSKSFIQNKNRTALESETISLTYLELAEQVNSTLALLVDYRVQKNNVIGIYCKDYASIVSSILAILYRRCTFVPLDTNLPVERLDRMVRQAGVNYILHDIEGADKPQLTRESCQWLDVRALPVADKVMEESYDPEDLIYIYFTSGSTGVPKGVIGKNKSLAHFIKWEIENFDLRYKRFSQLTNIGFDASLRDILLPIAAGGTICVSPKDLLLSADKMVEWVSNTSINIIHCVPSVFKIIRDGKVITRLPDTLDYIFMAGEKIIPGDLVKWYDNYGWRTKLVNLYGLTETTLVKAFHIVEPADLNKDFISVRPMSGTAFHIVGASGEKLQKGELGTICIASEYLAAGYCSVNDQGETYLADSISGFGEYYHTGDIGRELDSGEFQIVGRTDQQIKIQGVRIDLDEIKALLLKCEGVTDALVSVFTDKYNEPILCAYVSSSETGEADIKHYLSRRLPSYMIPAFLRILPAFPLLSNGKIDHKSLPTPEWSDKEILPAGNDTELKLLEIANKVFSVSIEKISVTDNIVEIGRQSIKLMMFLNLVKKEFGVNTSMQLIFEKGTFRSLSDYLITTSPLIVGRDDEETIEISI